MKSFTYRSYKKLLTILKKDYDFTSFSKIKFSNEPIERKVLLRHDIDLSLEKALELAKIEKELKITSTFFLFLRNPFYNIFSEESGEIINKIIPLNHNIGLHFDCSKYAYKTIPQLAYQVTREIEFIQDFFGIKLDAVSFHRPVSLEFYKKLEISSCPHSYEPIFVKRFKYFSDSRGEWRYGHPLKSNEYKERKNLHILIHPIWWNRKHISSVQCINNFKSFNTKKMDDGLHKELKSFWKLKK
jgi:hypothetical protein